MVSYRPRYRISSREMCDITSGCTSKPFNLLRHVCPTLVQTSSEVSCLLPYSECWFTQSTSSSATGTPGPPCCESASRPQMTMRSLVHIPVRRSQMRERTEVFEYEFFAHRVLCHGTKFDSTRERSRSSWLSFPLGTEISPQHQSQRSHLTT